jgi:hypothetical protein
VAGLAGMAARRHSSAPLPSRRWPAPAPHGCLAGSGARPLRADGLDAWPTRQRLTPPVARKSCPVPPSPAIRPPSLPRPPRPSGCRHRHGGAGRRALGRTRWWSRCGMPTDAARRPLRRCRPSAASRRPDVLDALLGRGWRGSPAARSSSSPPTATARLVPVAHFARYRAWLVLSARADGGPFVTDNLLQGRRAVPLGSVVSWSGQHRLARPRCTSATTTGRIRWWS